jgi:hypothetical protein
MLILIGKYTNYKRQAQTKCIIKIKQTTTMTRARINTSPSARTRRATAAAAVKKTAPAKKVVKKPTTKVV